MGRRMWEWQAVREVVAFWRKITNDWVFNLAAMLAYTLLLSAFPLFFVILVVGGAILNVIDPREVTHLQTHLAGFLPSGSQLLFNAVYHLHEAGGFVFIFLLATAIFTGSRFFLTIENCFGVIFRVPSRHPVHQNIMAVLMLLLCSVLIPLILVGSVVPSTLVVFSGLDARNPAVALAVQVFGAAGAVVASAALFGVIYLVVPNLRRRPHHLWRGTLTAAGLLVIYEALFPIFAHLVLRPATYGATVGLVVAVLLFFYYLALILLLGAEIDAWAMGIRDLPGDIALLLHRAEPFHHPKEDAAEAIVTPEHPDTPAEPVELVEPEARDEPETRRAAPTHATFILYPPQQPGSPPEVPPTTREPASSR